MRTLGLIGLGKNWEAEYRVVVAGLRRLQVCAVYDVVAQRAAVLAKEINAATCPSVGSLLRRADVRAVLVLNTGSHALWSVAQGVRLGKATFLADIPWHDRPRLQELQQQAEATGGMVVPEVRLRFTPVTMRLRELIAVKLGAIQNLLLDARLADRSLGNEVQFVDWCGSLLQTTLESCQRHPDKILASFRRPGQSRPGQSGQSVPVEILLPTADTTTENCSRRFPQVSLAVSCEKGSAQLQGETEIEWQVEGEERQQESLTGDRGSLDLLLDLFCRRAMGGIVPVPVLGDLLHVLQHLEAAR